MFVMERKTMSKDIGSILAEYAPVYSTDPLPVHGTNVSPPISAIQASLDKCAISIDNYVFNIFIHLYQCRVIAIHTRLLVIAKKSR